VNEHKRSTYLVDRPFQLKASALIVGLTLLVGVPLGAIILREASEAVSLGREAVEIGQTANGASTEALKQAALLNKRLEMETVLRYGNDPKQLEQTKAANAVETAKLEKQAAAIQAEATRLLQQRDALERTRKTLIYGVGGGIAALVLLVGLFGIFFTHRVAGPIHRMRALFRDVGDGKFTPYRPLRKGDELQAFFAEFSTMVERLKARQKEEIAHLEEAIEKASKAGVSDGSLYDLRAVRDAMKKAIEGKPSEAKLEV
jgi:nitrogen fixation/metabolism regulation signal transduction histidine kinase